jgi:hypothetical protein
MAKSRRENKILKFLRIFSKCWSSLPIPDRCRIQDIYVQPLIFYGLMHIRQSFNHIGTVAKSRSKVGCSSVRVLLARFSDFGGWEGGNVATEPKIQIFEI